ncbi:MAG: tRNA uridine-5-carboxymethylaminomethyl(34) synthesis GTPase MnmE [Oscillospiraceae bacterium]|nr:tRNA uridine-5-carboxymethylaminomethyl(34) synthesis GTPase MnmE [Oscillospiraceae bacterium]
MKDTIAAISTGSVLSAIGIIRLSGPDTLEIIDKVFTPSHGQAMSTRRDRLLVYGELHDAVGTVLDLCLCTVSRGPGSYTGEDTAELQCHGSPTVLQEGLRTLFAAGARQALPGEFTKRAFLNGRMDLTQAEAVIDLIHAETAEAAKNAAGQLGGAIVRKTDAIYDALKDISAHYHAVLDYPDEDIEDFQLESYSSTLTEAENTLSALLASFDRGRVMREGVPAVILGKPNAGKSSLLNALLGYDRAIVTDIPGTTRDTITEKVRLGRVLLRLTDTAGLRDTADTVERIGVDRARAAADEAELALVLIDPTDGDGSMDILESVQHIKHIILIFTKSDLKNMQGSIISTGSLRIDSLISLSSVTGEGLDMLTDAVEALYPPEAAPAGEILTNSRHADAVGRALESIRMAKEAMDFGLTPDAVLVEAEEAMAALGELSGKTVREDITSRIFERFCVGK